MYILSVKNNLESYSNKVSEDMQGSNRLHYWKVYFKEKEKFDF